ncbi:MAG: PAS domain S-box protein, partial [Ilumatobacter sp.]|nr:PAS domain S-box protein [Ilumatobacter sp.]
MNRSLFAPVGLALLGIAGIVAYLTLEPTRTTEWLAFGVPALAAAAVYGAMVLHRPARPVPWFLYGTGIAVFGLAALVRASEWYGDSGMMFPAGAEAVAVLAYPSLFVATISITSGRRHARDLLAGSEPIIYAIALTALVWLAVTGPYLDDSRLPMTRESWIWIFPLFDGLLALLALRRVGNDDRNHWLFGVMTLGFLLLGASHIATAWSAFDDQLALGGPLAASALAGPLVLGLVATLPAIPKVTAATGEPFRVHWSQIFGLLFAALIPLGALILMLASGLSSMSSFIVVSIATVCVIVLALARMWRLVDQVRLLTEQRGHARLAAMVEHSSDVVLLADDEGHVNYASPGLRATLGYDPESWSGRHLFDVVIDEDREAAVRQFERLVEYGHGGTVEFEAGLIHADGQHRKANVVVANLVGGAAVDGIVATFRDVTEQRNLERQLSHR